MWSQTASECRKSFRASSSWGLGTASYTPNITQFTYELDGTAIGNAFASPWGWLLLNWNTTGVANGSHTLTAVATYSDGATATSPGVTVTIANP